MNLCMPSGRQDQASAVSTGTPLVTTTSNSIATGGSMAGRGNRPRPLKLTAETNGHHSPFDDPPMATEETIRLMHQINQAVKAGSLTANLSSQIFRLYNELRHNGEYLDQIHKDEISRVFLSLRQACCRDAGQLGTPCRLKIMELIELRAMGWRSNLAHSQYYMSRGQPESEAGQASSGGYLNDYGPVPVSAPPFGAIPVNPFGMGFPHPGAMPQAPPDAYGMGNAGHQPQFYIIPASNVAHTQAGIAFVNGSGGGPGGGAPPGLGGNPAMGMRHPGHPGGFLGAPSPMTGSMGPGQAAAFMGGGGGPQSATSAGSMTMSQGSPISGGSAGSPGAPGSASSGFPKGAAWKTSGKFHRPQRVPGKNQFRDEIIIRNADSGKVMGIKGRRIAIIEELSKTIVSFQKVPPGAKERTLTITGPTEESIERAKGLLDQTIKRNASPTRGGGGEGDEQDDADLYAELALKMGDGDIFGLTCNDPKLLEVAKVALKEYFDRHVQHRRSFNNEDGLSKEERKERRKSMPPISQPDVTALPEMENHVSQLGPEPDAGPNKSKLFQSTPNLVQMGPKENGHSSHDVSTELTEATSALDISGRSSDMSPLTKKSVSIAERLPQASMRVVYTREFLLQCAKSPLAAVQPPDIQQVADSVDEVIRPTPGKFDPAEYKEEERANQLLQQQALAAAAAEQQQLALEQMAGMDPAAPCPTLA